MNFIVFRISKYKNTTLCEPKELSFEESEWKIQDSTLNKKKISSGNNTTLVFRISEYKNRT